jgi:integrase
LSHRKESESDKPGVAQMRQGHWAVADLTGKGGHVRTVPVPGWVKVALDQGTAAAGYCSARPAHDLRTTLRQAMPHQRRRGGAIQFLLGHASVQTMERYLECKQNLGHPVNDLFNLGTSYTPHEPGAQRSASPPLGTTPSQG